MIGAAWEIRGKLKVLSPLHIGTGEGREATRGNDTVPVAAIARTHTGDPYLPGSTLKGVLRRQRPDEDLFGPASITGAEDGRLGQVLFRNAWLVAGPDGHARRVAQERSTEVPDPSGRRSTFVEAHVGMNPKTGVAEPGRLFHEDMVLPGSQFELRLVAMDRLGVLDRVRALLSCLTAPEGLAFGAGTRTGDGRLRLDRATVEHRRSPDQAGWKRLDLANAASGKVRWTLRLTSDVPFLIHDPDRPAQGDRQNVLRGLADFGKDAQRLTGTSLMGALRAGFADFAARTLGKRADALTQVLFGSTDQRGRLAIRTIRLADPGRSKESMSVRIDRLTGGPIDNALFATEGRFGASYVVEFVTEERKAGSGDAAEADRAFEGYLVELKDKDWGGLMLGHATNRGYGWFRVEGV